MCAHLAHATFGLKLNRKYKTIYRGIHYKHNLFSTLSTHGFLVTVKLTACLKYAMLFCTCPSHSCHQYVRALRVFCFMSVSALYEWLWNINRSMFQMKKSDFISENITFRRFITSGSLHYYSKSVITVLKPLQWSRDVPIPFFPSRYRFRYLGVGYRPIPSTDPIPGCVSGYTAVCTTSPV